MLSCLRSLRLSRWTAFYFVTLFAHVVVSTSLLYAEEAPPTAEQLAHFEREIRPRLHQHCVECHGPQKSEAGLRLDTKAGFRKGSDTGPVYVPTNPDASRFLQVLAYAPNDTQMPPKGKLADAEITLFRDWIRAGAAWPEDVASGGPAQPHWAFQPVVEHALPAVTDEPRVQTWIDRFILAKLEPQGLSLAAPAERAAFIRRATLDLWGVPPTYEQVQAYVQDQDPQATAKLIDRLLASPLYGQRWARHWLDVARYADTKGYVFTQAIRYPFAYTYRDYVVDALNTDKPYDQFVREQLAADLITPADQPAPLAALGFLTVGRRFLNNPNDIADDRIDVVSRGFLGLTLTCCRCHDHKSDPLTAQDYYGLYGVFASSLEPDELPVIGRPPSDADYEAYLTELQRRRQALESWEQQTTKQLTDEMRSRLGDYFQELAKQQSPVKEGFRVEPSIPKGRNGLIARWQRWLDQHAKPDHPVFGPWQQLVRATPEEYSQRLPELTKAASAGATSLHPRVRAALLQSPPPATIYDLARLYGQVFVEAEQRWQEFLKQSPEAKFHPDRDEEALRALLHDPGTPTALTVADSRAGYDQALGQERDRLRKEIEQWNMTAPGSPPRAMVMKDHPQPRDFPVLLRGNPGRPGPVATRRFIQVLAQPNSQPFHEGSGRRQLAEAIVDPANPLTRRVIVNRLWQHHFGVGLVTTPSDFGAKGQPPSHPELLDNLAQQLIRDGWSLKAMHRLIMNSAVYQQASDAHPTVRERAALADPENRLLWHVPRWRLELEAMRDSWLFVAGLLDVMPGGRPFEDINDPRNHRRSLYALVNRNDLPATFRAFDFADVDASTPARPLTTVPQQALFAMNSPLVVEIAKSLGAASAAAGEPAARVRWLYQRILARNPQVEEITRAVQYVESANAGEQLTPWDRLAQILLLTNEFLFVD